MDFLRQGIRDSSPVYIYIIGLFVIAFGFVLGRTPLDIATYYQMTQHTDITDITIKAFNSNPDFSLIHMNSSLGLLLLIMIFVFALIALLTWYTKVHKLKAISLINRFQSIDKSRILFGFGLWIIFIVLMELLYYIMGPESFYLKLDLKKFLLLLPVALLFLPIQTTTEELVFRSYLPKGLAKFIPSPFIIILITSALFALIHAGNPEVHRLGIVPMMTYYFSAGVFLAIVTILDDRLELALGIHAAVNIFGTLIVSYKDSALQTDAIWSSDTPNPWIATLCLVISAIIFVYICSRKYNWPPIKVIFNKIDTIQNEA